MAAAPLRFVEWSSATTSTAKGRPARRAPRGRDVHLVRVAPLLKVGETRRGAGGLADIRQDGQEDAHKQDGDADDEEELEE